MIPEGAIVTMTAGSNTYEYVAGKPLPFNKEPRDWVYSIPHEAYTISNGESYVSEEVYRAYGPELLESINKPGGTQTLYKGFVGQVPEVMQKPSVGRIVHYHTHGGVLAAVITAVSGDDSDIRVSLCILNLDGTDFKRNVSYSVSTPGCWSWPPRA